MKETILNGILCSHNLPVDDFESNDNVLFLHNEYDPLGMLIRRLSVCKKIGFSYFISDQRQSIDVSTELLLKRTMGAVSADVSSSSHPYSEVTPDLCYSHNNEFEIGGHNLNRELGLYIGKWILIRITHCDT